MYMCNHDDLNMLLTYGDVALSLGKALNMALAFVCRICTSIMYVAGAMRISCSHTILVNCRFAHQVFLPCTCTVGVAKEGRTISAHAIGKR